MYLYGLHEGTKDFAYWTIQTVAIGRDPNNQDGANFSDYNDYVICRINNGYAPDGTLPERRYYSDFARRVQNFVKNTVGCHRFVVANETNLSIEWPNGVPIMPQDYADCFNLCYQKIKEVKPESEVLLVPIGPWNVETGIDWIDYFTQTIDLCDNIDGFAIHTYAREQTPESVTSEAKMDAPYDHLYSGFRTYRDWMDNIPDRYKHLPVYLTECNANQPWQDVNTGFVQAAYKEIDDWNKTPGTQKIHCLCLYRWPQFDKYYIKGKQGVIEDFEKAIEKGYTVGETPEMPETNYILNPTFQEPYYEDGAGEKKVAHDWKTFFDESKRRWEWRRASGAESSPNWENAQQWFESDGTGDGGVFQTLYVGQENVGKYARLVCQVALESKNTGSGIGEYYASIGIDRIGSADPFNDQTVEWTTPLHQFYCPKWTTIEKIAKIENDWITVYLRAYNKYRVDGSMFAKSAYLYIMDDPCPGEPDQPDPPTEPGSCLFDDTDILDAIENAKQEVLNALGDVVKITDVMGYQRQ